MSTLVRENDKDVRKTDDSKEHLREVANKRFTTVMIGALDTVEKTLGDLWGHNRPLEELTEDEKRLRTKYKRLRHKILDFGNDQRKFFINELDGYYDVNWKVRHYEFKAKEDSDVGHYDNGLYE